jgi:hypothetical protein
MDEGITLRMAKQALDAGDNTTARNLVLQVIRQNPQNETAWLWLSALVNDPKKERDCLQKVLEINPMNDIARQHFERLTVKVQPAPIPQPQPMPAAPRPVAQPSAVVQAAPQPSSVMPVPAGPYIALPTDQLKAILDREVMRQIKRGYNVQMRTDTTAQLVKPKQLNFLAALLWFLIAGVGLVVYLLFHWGQREKSVYIEVDPAGKISLVERPNPIIQLVVAVVLAILTWACMSYLCSSTSEWDSVSWLLMTVVSQTGLI